MNHFRLAFSLAEVLFALLILSLGILSIIMLFPVGIRAQDQVRYQMYASIKAMELSDAFAQHTKSFSDRVHEMTGDLSGEKIIEGAIYGSYARFDAEVVWAAGGQNGVYPVPIEIARRLDSPGGEIQQVLDAGGYLFYHDPRPVRGFSLAEATNPNGAKIAPELQRLVFAVVGAPQQNALPQHPALQGPLYSLYPFPPQGPKIRGVIVPAKVGTDGIPQHKYVWDYANAKADGFNTDFWEIMNWETLASYRFVDSPWRDGVLAFRNLCYFGWTPIEFKITQGSSGGGDPDPADGIPFNQDNVDGNGNVTSYGTIARFSRRPRGVAIDSETGAMGGSGRYWGDGNAAFWRHDLTSHGASFVPGYDPGVYAENPDPAQAYLTVLDAFHDPGVGLGAMSFRDFVNTPGLAGLTDDPTRFDTLMSEVIGDLLTSPTKEDPTTWSYRELGDNGDPRLPSLQQRYLYRWLALKLWRDVTVGSPLAGSNPLLDELWAPDGTFPDAISLHPARVLALSHLADAAIRVGGMRLPMWEPVGAYTGNPIEFTGATNDGAIDRSAVFPGSSTDVAGPRQATAVDVQMGKIAHENCLRWAIAYADRFPRDNLVPRPSNRQTMVDRSFWQWDLFDSAGNALRNNTPNTWQGSPRAGVMPAYKILPRPGIDPASSNRDLSGRSLPLPRLAPGVQIEGGSFRYTGDMHGVAASKWFERMSRTSEPTFDVMNAERARRFSLNLPFAPQNRMRQIVYWAVDWKAYEDSESAPSAPHGAEILSRGMWNDHYWGSTPTASSWNDFDPSESSLIWFGRDREITFASSLDANSSTWSGGSASNRRFYARRVAQGNTLSWSRQVASIRDFFDREGINHTFGLFGADRDGNGVYQGGNLAASARLRALEVARFNFYDPVVWCHVRK